MEKDYHMSLYLDSLMQNLDKLLHMIRNSYRRGVHHYILMYRLHFAQRTCTNT
ncbi:hypothetical protein TTHERM_000042739 (macronuclear) [Tetrahymena thermophila SB210]|uniref:Uncharacterized protein n=1 Tax=Tetrahymena thermophila (strain SB210) TaxID=312017 RepID=W7XEB8_TETTS|nr:hypothetical protein TTHERM_000042739 [Tetrahymena thermophila SB210]EWS74923.1 hypothetical protein TTHERM_000042739 [Tetrahymena thermophila SB210]|eukprot:XP_012652636.1 hypothetical protein TTHERM_000042739 [Tetrahymena thermophila SB210]